MQQKIKDFFLHRTELIKYANLFKNTLIGSAESPAAAHAIPCKCSKVSKQVQRGEASDAEHTHNVMQ
jgi:hypothetical protein